MEQNIYASPASQLEFDVDSPGHEFYVVSIKKFTVLFFITLGIYSIYWFYKNWSVYKAHNGASIWPIPRAIFNIFFAHSLFRKIDEVIKNREKAFGWSPETLATFYVIFAILSNVVDRLSMREVGTPYTDILSMVLLPILYVILLKAQKAVNISQNDMAGESNSTFTLANYVWILIGTIFWLFVAFGALVLAGIVHV